MKSLSFLSCDSSSIDGIGVSKEGIMPKKSCEEIRKIQTSDAKH